MAQPPRPGPGIPLTRRALIAGLTGTVACARRPPVTPPEAPPSGPLRLGWRWVPGTSHTFRTTVRRHVGPVVFLRDEVWRYVAHDLDPDGVAHLTGRRLDRASTVEADGTPVDDARLTAARDALAEASAPTVALGLRLSGRITHCSAEGFADQLPHRLIALHLPPDPVLPGVSWRDGALLRAFAPVLPVDVAVRTDARTTLADVRLVDDAWRAELAHTARLQVGSVGPAIEITGTSTWDTDPGALRARTLTARWQPDTPAGGMPVGTLDLGLARQDGP